MLNLMEPYDLKAMGPQSAEWLHILIEAKKLAYEDRAKYYADPEFVKVPVSELISKSYAKTRGKLLDPSHATDHPTAGEPKPADTIYMTVVDGDFNAVSLIQSNYEGFGSDHAAGDLGFGLQNRGCLFALDPNHANRLEPGKRPFHTIIPAFVTKDGKPWLSFGLMGGDMQAQGHAQVISDIVDFGMDVQEAADAPRFYHQGSSTPTGHPREGWRDGRARVGHRARGPPGARGEGAHDRQPPRRGIRRLPGDPDRHRAGRPDRRVGSEEGRGGDGVLMPASDQRPGFASRSFTRARKASFSRRRLSSSAFHGSGAPSGVTPASLDTLSSSEACLADSTADRSRARINSTFSIWNLLSVRAS